MDHRQQLGKHLLQFLKDRQIIGIGTGSTVDAALPVLLNRVREQNLNVQFVATSIQTAQNLAAAGQTVLDMSTVHALDWGFDGADAVNAQRNAIKGRGAAMLREKMMAVLCQNYYLIVDQAKFTENLVNHCPVPVEIIPDAFFHVEKELKKITSQSVALRMAVRKHGPVVTERGNLIIDVEFSSFSKELETQIKSIVGVVETGLFTNFADKVFVLNGQEVVEY